MDRKIEQLDESRLMPDSKALLIKLLSWKPEWKKYCSMEQDSAGSWNLLAKLPSPTGDSHRELIIFFANDANDVSLAFSTWHTHETVTFRVDLQQIKEISILEGVKLFVAGDLVTYRYLPGNEQEAGIVYLPSRWGLEDVLTNKYSTGRIVTKSWDGTRDREITIANLESLNRGH